MDLHFNSATATEDDHEAVDEILGPPIAGERHERHLLLPVLHAIQRRAGWISPGALNYACRRLAVPPAEGYGVASFYALFSTTPQPATVVHICDDIACKTNGAEELCAGMEARFGPAGTRAQHVDAAWKRSPCLGLCETGPCALIQKSGSEATEYSLAPTNAGELTAAMVGEPYAGRATLYATPQFGGSGLNLLARVGVIDPESLDEYLAHGGYSALRRALKMGPAAVIQEISDAKLTGRGGAAFPTGRKWKAVAEQFDWPHYVICNADESEPGTFKDRVLMEGDPFAVIESLTLAGFACGAEKGYIYIRGEYPEATERLQTAIDQAIMAGYLGGDILASGVKFDIEIRRGAGAYICGEETALLESIEGKRGEPRNKPPFPVTFGLFGKPTAINNVETLVNLLPIINQGATAYAAIGTPDSTGTRLFCLSGCVEQPGVYEIPYGKTLGELIEMAGGVRHSSRLQAVLLGGAAGTFVGPNELDIPLTLEGARAAGATLGSGVVMLFDQNVDMKAILLRIAAFFRDESCGQCVPCRVGTVRQEEVLHRLMLAKGTTNYETELLEELEMVMRDASICGLGQTAAGAILSAVHRPGLFTEITS